MTISIDNFMKNASDEQKDLFFDLVDLGKKENEVCQAYNKKIDPYLKEANRANPVDDMQYENIIKEDMNDLALLATIEERKELKNIRKDMKKLYLNAINLEMGTVGIIERNYEHYVGKKIPKQN